MRTKQSHKFGPTKMRPTRRVQSVCAIVFGAMSACRRHIMERRKSKICKFQNREQKLILWKRVSRVLGFESLDKNEDKMFVREI